VCDLIAPIGVVFFCDELRPDAVFELCRAGKGSNEPAVTHCTLTKVGRLDLAFKELRALFFAVCEYTRKPVELVCPHLRRRYHTHTVRAAPLPDVHARLAGCALWDTFLLCKPQPLNPKPTQSVSLSIASPVSFSWLPSACSAHGKSQNRAPLLCVR